MRPLLFCAVMLSSSVFAVSAAAQSPNTATIVVSVVDQSNAVVKDAAISIANSETGASREVMSGSDGTATVPALSLTGTYTVSVTRPGFASQTLNGITLRAGETATIRVKLLVGNERSEVTVYGTAQGVRADPQLGQRLDSRTIDETPILGRKITTLPLLNAAFRQAKGTGDLFVNATYFVTGAGGRRQPAVTIDGATNDDPWGRQTMLATVPVGAVEEMTVLSHAFSAEFGWTASAALNIVTKSGTNAVHGDALFLGRPGNLQTKQFSTDLLCPDSAPACESTATAISPADVPDSLAQGSFSIGAPIAKDTTHLFVAADVTRQDRTARLTSPLVAPDATIVGRYRQALVDARLDHKVSAAHSIMGRVNVDRFYDTNPQDVVSGNALPSAGREFTRHTWSAQVNETAILSRALLNEVRFEYLDGDPITQFEPVDPSTQYTRAGSAPFTVGESRFAHIFSRQVQFSDTLSWTFDKHYVRAGGSVVRATSGGDGTEFGSPFVLGQFTVLAATTRPFDQITLADVQSYTQGFNFGVGSYEQKQWLLAGFLQDSFRARSDLTLDLGIRYDRQTFSDATKNFAPRVGFGWNPGANPKTAIRGGYGLYWTQLRSNLAANFELNGPEGIGSYTAGPGQTGFPSCLTCTPVVFDPAAAASTLPARNVTIRPGRREFYTQQFARFGVDFSRVPDYPDALVNPRSEVVSFGVERELAWRVFVGADYVHQHWSNLDRTVDLNAPAPFDRTEPGQVRSTAAADATRPIAAVNGGFRSINAIINLGVADYDALQTIVSYRGSSRVYASVSYTLSKATNTTEPDGNGIGSNDANIARLGEEERGPSLLDQRHRAVITLTGHFPYNLNAGAVTQLASARPFNAVTGVDNNGDRANNDRPVIDGKVVGKSAFRGTPTEEVSVFIEERVKLAGTRAVLLRVEGFNLFNRANILGRTVTTYGNGSAPSPSFGLVAAGSPVAVPGLANIDPPRMVQFQARFVF